MATNEKISIEFVSNNYVGTLLPNLDPIAESISWNNSGSIVITSPMSEDNWNRATVVSCEVVVSRYSSLFIDRA